MIEDKCESCNWWRDKPFKDKFGNIAWLDMSGTYDSKRHWGLCHLFPTPVWKEKQSFCGQWKEKK